MEQPLTIVLPVESESGRTTRRAAALVDLDGAHIGVVDNCLWRSMAPIVATFEAALGERATVTFETLVFDHLAADFGEALIELGSFAQRVDGAITGLGN